MKAVIRKHANAPAEVQVFQFCSTLRESNLEAGSRKRCLLEGMRIDRGEGLRLAREAKMGGSKPATKTVQVMCTKNGAW